MHPDMPIEQPVRRLDTRFQLGFALEAKERLPGSEEFRLQPSREALLVLAKNEEALGPPVETLREMYGARLEVRPPRVRLLPGVQLREPIMHVRISLHERFRGAVKALMHARGAALEEEYLRGARCVLRYEAALARLLGLAGELAACTEAAAQHWIALSHYAIVTGDPGGDAA